MGTQALRTRAQLMAAYGLGRSTLEKWYRERAGNGHPEAAGTVGRELAWDAAEWDVWYASRQKTEHPGLLSRDQLAERYGLSRHALKKLWAERETNGHPQPARQVGKALYWDADAWAAWYAGLSEQSEEEEDPEDLVTLAEVGRILGLAQSSVTVYAKRPPAGWPQPVAEEQLGGGRVRRLYRRGDVTAYARAKR
jgi:predicted DNA-binding transcriptional regulator AlpA